ncbi:MAG: molybdopterin-dependent oxidoreductase [Alphaproteobacteria bacterium]|nr:molybdopterin-dependent oxidoreductase [Alphaproteobacteria bacterium]
MAPLDLSSAWRSSACPHDCPSTCALEVEVLDGTRIGRVRGAEANPYTAGVICAKVARYAERLTGANRITKPLLRTGPKGTGQFHPISWEEALDRATAGIQHAITTHGPESFWPYYYAGTMGQVQRDGINRLRHVLKASRMDKTICTRLAETGWYAGTGAWGGPDSREMAEADVILVWGGNPVATQVNVMTHITTARKTRGAQLVVIDPYRSGTAAVADLHLALRPGTDDALAHGVAHCLLRDGLVDRDYLAQFSDFSPAVEDAYRRCSPAWAAEITGLSVDAIEALARLIGETQRCYIRLGYGLSRTRNGANALHAITCLPTLTGSWRHRGGGAFWSQRDLYHLDKTLVEGLDMVDRSTRLIDMCLIGRALTGDPEVLAGGPPIQAMLVQNTNPAVVAPNTSAVLAGLAREDLFLIVHEQVMTDTARYADLVLPATMFVEHDDLYTAGGHTHLQAGPKLVDPPGQCRTNHWLINQLAERLGVADRSPAFTMTDVELADATLTRSGWGSYGDLVTARWIDCARSEDACHFRAGFGWPDGRFRFQPDWPALGRFGGEMPTLPNHLPPGYPASPRHPYRLLTSPARQFLNTSFNETPTAQAREGRPTVLIAEADAIHLGIADGDRVALSNDLGRVIVHAKRVASGQAPGTVVVEGLWSNHAFEGGLGINTLVSDEPGWPAGGGIFHDTAVAIDRIG